MCSLLVAVVIWETLCFLYLLDFEVNSDGLLYSISLHFRILLPLRTQGRNFQLSYVMKPSIRVMMEKKKKVKKNILKN